MTQKFRFLHRWLAPIVFIQLLLWVISGIFFSWNNLNRSLSETEKFLQPDSLISIWTQLPQVEPKDTDLLSDLERLAQKTFPTHLIQSARYAQLGNRQILIISGPKIPRTVRFFADDLSEITYITKDMAETLAKLSISDTNAIQKEFSMQKEFDVYYASFFYELPVYKFIFESQEHGEVWVFISPRTGDVVARLGSKHRLNRVMFSWFHIMEYSQSKEGRIMAYSLLLIFSLIAAGTMLTGFPLFFKKLSGSKND